MDYDLTKRSHRYLARKRGVDVPKLLPGPQSSLEDHLKKIDKSGECWIWKGYVNQWGYGTFSLKCKTTFIHRVMWELENKKSAKGLIIMHSCDNPRCCNPKHLSAGTHKDNQLDKLKKNRQARGITNGTHKLTEKEVIEIRQTYISNKITYQELGLKFNVSKDTIQKIIHKKAWKHL